MHYDKLPFYDLSLRIRQASRIDKLPIDRYVLYLHREQSEPYNPTYNQQTEATTAALHSGSKWLKSAKNKFVWNNFITFSKYNLADWHNFRFRWLHILYIENLSN